MSHGRSYAGALAIWFNHSVAFLFCTDYTGFIYLCRRPGNHVCTNRKRDILTHDKILG